MPTLHDTLTHVTVSLSLLSCLSVFFTLLSVFITVDLVLYHCFMTCFYIVLFDLLANRYSVAASLKVPLKEKTNICPMFSSLAYIPVTTTPKFDS